MNKNRTGRASLRMITFYEDDFCLASPAQPGRCKFTGLVVRLAKKYGRIEMSGMGKVVKTWKKI